jgi:hypothetical protein
METVMKPRKNAKPRGPTPEHRRLRDLHPFPAQAQFFDDLSDHDLAELAADIKRNGLRHPIELLPQNKAGYTPNTILSGHQRDRALRLNGETETVALVRYDLAEADKESIERHFLEHNQHRRQQDVLATARVALRLFEIEKKRPVSKFWVTPEARDRVGAVIGMSGRNLQRYLDVLRTPLEVQNALRNKNLSLVQAAKVASLVQTQQERIAGRIRAGEEPKAVVAEFLPTANGRHVRLDHAMDAFARSLQRSLDDLDDRIASVPARLVKLHLPVLQQAAAALETLLAKAGLPEEPPELDEREWDMDVHDDSEE